MNLFRWGHGNIGPAAVDFPGKSSRIAGSSWPPQCGAVSRDCVGDDAIPSSAQKHLGIACYQVTKQPSVVVANCSDTEANAAFGGAQRWFAETEGTKPPLERLLFLPPGHTCGCQAVEDCTTGNGYLMTGLVQIKSEYLLFVPSGFALELAVNGARRWV